ncbi:hypothetical protein DL764_002671 [Monosporascus ibericus]|uniref:Uncharacterized protein n=1 Tax=Monosporascus ibericus TaxID=155417 RepID=A0A4Q4TJM6_9PEZI|nr:hypothetical protein DL764_002671 [Monosporascus ibericus]
MPKPNSSNGGGEAARSSFTKRFELPALDFKFGSLTEGTNIPPPLPSPVEKVPTPPKTPVEAQKPAVQEEKTEKTNGHFNGSERPPKPDIATPPFTYAGVKRPAEDGPASPTGSSRGSLRRLLSMSLLNKTYDEQAPPPSSHEQSGSRPPSRTTTSTMTEEKKSRRTSGWFRRLRSQDHSGLGASHSSENKRMSQQFIQTTPPKPAGPPPPMIPELSALGTKVDTSIGDDIFKGIK